MRECHGTLDWNEVVFVVYYIMKSRTLDTDY